MDLVDVHAHLDHPDFKDDLDEVLKRAKAKGISCVIAQGINHESNVKNLELAKKDPIIKVALGYYPSEFMNVKLNKDYSRDTAYDVEKTFAFIEANIEKAFAIGEVGLDFKESEDKETQIENFRKIIKLAKKYRKPIIIHSRKAEEEVLNLLEEEKVKRVVLHCFMGKKKLVERGVKLGYSFSIPTAVTRNKQFQDNTEIVPMSQILTETDSPYMGPMKDIRNEPGNIRDAILKIAEIKRLDPIEVANAIYFNFQKLFQ